jgi:probable rRNA maturation factor
MAVQIHIDGDWEIPDLPGLKKLIRQVSKGEKMTRAVELVLTGNPLVRQLNREHRGLDKVTDVLSFVYDETDLLGEIYVALPQVKSQAPRWKNSYKNELRRVVVHGLLHLAGYDHHTLPDRKVMRGREDFYLKTVILRVSKPKPPAKTRKKRSV